MTGAGQSHMPQQSQQPAGHALSASNTYYMCVHVLRTVHSYISQRDMCETARRLTMVVARNCFAKAGYTIPPNSAATNVLRLKGWGTLAAKATAHRRDNETRTTKPMPHQKRQNAHTA